MLRIYFCELREFRGDPLLSLRGGQLNRLKDRGIVILWLVDPRPGTGALDRAGLV